MMGVDRFGSFKQRDVENPRPPLKQGLLLRILTLHMMYFETLPPSFKLQLYQSLPTAPKGLPVEASFETLRS